MQLSEHLETNLTALNARLGSSADFYAKRIELYRCRGAILLFDGMASLESLWELLLDAASRQTPPLLWSGCARRRAGLSTPLGALGSSCRECPGRGLGEPDAAADCWDGGAAFGRLCQGDCSFGAEPEISFGGRTLRGREHPGFAGGLLRSAAGQPEFAAAAPRRWSWRCGKGTAR